MAPRPGRIVPIPLAHPRDRATRAFARIKEEALPAADGAAVRAGHEPPLRALRFVV